MGESTGSEEVIRRQHKNRHVVQGSRGIKSPSNFKKAIERATQAVLVGSAIVAGGKAVVENVKHSNSESNTRISRDIGKGDEQKIVVNIAKDGTLTVSGSGNKKQQVEASKKEFPNSMLPKIEPVRPIADKKHDSILEVFPNASGEEYARIFQKVLSFEKPVARDVDLVSMQAFLKGWGEHLEIQARKHNLDPDTVGGGVLVESGGKPKAVSGTGAIGVAQLMPDTAKRYNVDPTNPYESVIGMCEYLSDLREQFGGDMSLAIWAYHAGEGNVMNGLRYYFLNKYNFDIGNYEKSLGMADDKMRLDIERNAKENIKKYNVRAFDLFENPAVRNNVLNDLEDDTENYVYKVIVGAKLLNKTRSQ